MVDTPAYVYDLLNPAVLRNPHPTLADMRVNAPVYQLHHREMGSRPWVLTRYTDALDLLKDERFTKSISRRPSKQPANPNDMMAMAASTINRHMLTVDPPDHTRLRSLVHKAFTPKMIRALESRMHEICNDLIDQVQGDKHMDFILDFALPLPITVIADLLGVPHSDQDKFRYWTQTIVVDGVKNPGTERIATAVLEFIMYFHELFDKRRVEPADDLISGLVQVEDAGDKLDPQELISMVFLLLVAGHETTVNLIGNGTLALLQYPDQMRRLQSEPELLESAIEEMLRFDGPVGVSTMRWALDDVEWHGETIPAGDMVVASLLGANRDPEVFENPDTFDITRTPNRHIAFGHGIHYCLGAPLARLEGMVAFETLLKRLPQLQLDCEVDEIEWNETVLLHSMKSMPVRF